LLIIARDIKLATNKYEALDRLEQATEAISAILIKCEFYHGLYTSFASNRTPSTFDYGKAFSTFEDHLPQLYAAVLELSVKAKKYINPPSIGCEYRCSPCLYGPR
jgi:hypothetical protein